MSRLLNKWFNKRNKENFEKKLKTQHASIMANQRHIFVETCSGRGLLVADPKGLDFRCGLEACNEELGIALFAALEKSREATDDQELFDRHKIEERSKKWIEDVLSTCGYRNKSQLFKSMMSCSVECSATEMVLRPWNHLRSDAWDGAGISEADWVRISASSSPEEVGEAVRLALSRCT